MDNAGLKIEMIWYDDYLIEYRLQVGNHTLNPIMEFYGALDTFKSFAEKLISFPLHAEEHVLFEAGDPEPNSLAYLKMDVFCYEPNGNTAIHVTVDNSGKGIPDGYRSEFYIKTIPATINRLGQMLHAWKPEDGMFHYEFNYLP